MIIPHVYDGKEGRKQLLSLIKTNPEKKSPPLRESEGNLMLHEFYHHLVETKGLEILNDWKKRKLTVMQTSLSKLGAKPKAFTETLRQDAS